MCLFHLAPQLPTNLPCSVSLQPGPDDKGKVNLLPLIHHRTIFQDTLSSLSHSCLSLSFVFQSCGVDFEVKTYLAMERCNPDEKIEKK